MKKLAFALVVLAVPTLAFAQQSDEPRQVGISYLNALTGKGDDSARALLLGGVTMDASLASLENWRIVSEDPVRKESGDLADAEKKMAQLDAAGRKALAEIVGRGTLGADLTTVSISKDDAQKLLGPTRSRAVAFKKSHPVLAYVARVDHEVYWHPKNPIRPLLQKLGKKGHYSLEVHRYVIETKEGPRQEPRRWPLRVVRLKVGGYDTGWKILPASDWSVD
jgi:hypothetical protein